ncbi:MAG: 6-pyruvoyl-tetrahydropterin synthase-related protein [Patescibacteria group bacterium]
MVNKIQKILKNKYTILLIVFTLVALWPFFKHSFFESHDGEWMIIRFSAFHQALVSGQFPVRYVDRLNNNYGYPVLNFLYPLPFYLAEIPKLLGFNFTNSIKIIFAVSTLVSTLAMFAALSQRFSRGASFVGSFVYLFIPYRFVDLYVRGSLGENLSFAIIPLALLSIFKIAKNSHIFYPFLSISVALLILSHNVIAFLFLPVLTAISLIEIKKDKIKALFAIILGVLMSTFFWFPALYDLQYVRLSQMRVANPIEHLIPLTKIIYSQWNFGSVPGQLNGFSAQLGVITALMICISIFIKIRKKDYSKLETFAIVVIIVSAFLISDVSSVVWKKIPLIDIIQFPWRLLSLVVFSTAILSAYCIEKINKPILTVGIVFLVFALVISYTKPKGFLNYPDSYYSTNEASTTVLDEYMPLWVKGNPQRVYSKIIPGLFSISGSIIKSADYSVRINVWEDTKLKIATIYFPGFIATIDGKPTPISYDSDGLINIQLPKGDHEVIIKYGKSPIHLASELISLTASFIVGILFFRLWQKQNS